MSSNRSLCITSYPGCSRVSVEETRQHHISRHKVTLPFSACLSQYHFRHSIEEVRVWDLAMKSSQMPIRNHIRPHHPICDHLAAGQSIGFRNFGKSSTSGGLTNTESDIQWRKLLLFDQEQEAEKSQDLDLKKNCIFRNYTESPIHATYTFNPSAIFLSA